VRSLFLPLITLPLASSGTPPVATEPQIATEIGAEVTSGPHLMDRSPEPQTLSRVFRQAYAFSDDFSDLVMMVPGVQNPPGTLLRIDVDAAILLTSQPDGIVMGTENTSAFAASVTWGFKITATDCLGTVSGGPLQLDGLPAFDGSLDCGGTSGRSRTEPFFLTHLQRTWSESEIVACFGNPWAAYGVTLELDPMNLTCGVDDVRMDVLITMELLYEPFP